MPIRVRKTIRKIGLTYNLSDLQGYSNQLQEVIRGDSKSSVKYLAMQLATQAKDNMLARYRAYNKRNATKKRQSSRSSSRGTGRLESAIAKQSIILIPVGKDSFRIKILDETILDQVVSKRGYSYWRSQEWGYNSFSFVQNYVWKYNPKGRFLNSYGIRGSLTPIRKRDRSRGNYNERQQRIGSYSSAYNRFLKNRNTENKKAAELYELDIYHGAWRGRRFIAYGLHWLRKQGMIILKQRLRESLRPYRQAAK